MTVELAVTSMQMQGSGRAKGVQVGSVLLDNASGTQRIFVGCRKLDGEPRCSRPSSQTRHTYSKLNFALLTATAQMPPKEDASNNNERPTLKTIDAANAWLDWSLHPEI